MSNKTTDLDRQLQEIALMDWQAFVEMVGQDAINKAKVCLLRKKKKSYGEICIRLNLTENQVRYSCGKC